jgi:hypothetical protein
VAHHGLGRRALGLDAGDLAVERVLAGACIIGLAVEEMEAQEEEETKHGERGHSDAQALERRTDDWRRGGWRD